jgi:hypothetical protein
MNFRSMVDKVDIAKIPEFSIAAKIFNCQLTVAVKEYTSQIDPKSFFMRQEMPSIVMEQYFNWITKVRIPEGQFSFSRYEIYSGIK